MVEQESITDEELQRIEHYNPVTVTITESAGLVAMSIIALVLLAALLRSQRRIRELQEQQPGQAADG